MLDWLHENISLSTLIWLFPITFLLHDFEEIILVEVWFRKWYPKFEHRVPNRLKRTLQTFAKTSAAKFSIPVVLQLIFYILACYLAAEKQMYGMFLGFNLLNLLHVFTHIGQSLFIRSYALGVVTAICITFPYSLYLFSRLLQDQIVNYEDIWSSLPYGILTIFVVLIGHKLAYRLHI